MKPILKKIKSINPDIEVVSKACPLFVPLVEEGILEGKIAELVVERYLKELKKTAGLIHWYSVVPIIPY